jgi:excinuclease ABC subunit C
MTLDEVKKIDLPDTPGVYFWKKGKTILYIGKATSLRDRVRSYFAPDLIETRGPAILDMTVQATSIDYQTTDSVLEALVLEAQLIKKHQPKYNVKEKDNKSFAYVIITDEVWPRVIMVRSRDLAIRDVTGRIDRINFDGRIKYSFGPFPSMSLLRDALKIIRKIFPFIDHTSLHKDQQSFYQQLGLIPSITQGDTVTPGERELHHRYLATIRHLILFFQGKKNTLVKQLSQQMMTAAREQSFEYAHLLKKKLFALQHINDVSLLKNYDHAPSEMRIEAYDVAHHAGTASVGVMTVMHDGYPDTSAYRKFIIRSGKGNDDYANLREILLRRFKHLSWGIPQLIVLDGGKGHYAVAQQVLQELQLTIPLVSVIKDERHKPKAFHGDVFFIKKYKKEILLMNSEAHRFALAFHVHTRTKNFIPPSSKERVSK